MMPAPKTTTVRGRDLRAGDRIVLFPNGEQDTIMPIISVGDPTPSKWGERVFVRWGKPEGAWVGLSDRYLRADAEFQRVSE